MVKSNLKMNLEIKHAILYAKASICLLKEAYHYMIADMLQYDIGKLKLLFIHSHFPDLNFAVRYGNTVVFIFGYFIR